MALAQGEELASLAPAEAGGLGSLPAAMLTPERLRQQIATVSPRRAMGRPFQRKLLSPCDCTPDLEIEGRWREATGP